MNACKPLIGVCKINCVTHNIQFILQTVAIWPACFICSSKAEMPNGYEIQANVAANTVINVK